MKEVIKKHITFAGIEKPETVHELKVEIYGLKNAIKIAEELISRHEQVLSIIFLEQEAGLYASQEKSISEDEKSEREQKSTKK
jgi:sulfur relay (sulfurtransferase) complex TusBCD TusD component (DsrE family)